MLGGEGGSPKLALGQSQERVGVVPGGGGAGGWGGGTVNKSCECRRWRSASSLFCFASFNKDADASSWSCCSSTRCLRSQQGSSGSECSVLFADSILHRKFGWAHQSEGGYLSQKGRTGIIMWCFAINVPHNAQQGNGSASSEWSTQCTRAAPYTQPDLMLEVL